MLDCTMLWTFFNLVGWVIRKLENNLGAGNSLNCIKFEVEVVYQFEQLAFVLATGGWSDQAGFFS